MPDSKEVAGLGYLFVEVEPRLGSVQAEVLLRAKVLLEHRLVGARDQRLLKHKVDHKSLQSHYSATRPSRI